MRTTYHTAWMRTRSLKSCRSRWQPRKPNLQHLRHQREVAREASSHRSSENARVAELPHRLWLAHPPRYQMKTHAS